MRSGLLLALCIAPLFLHFGDSAGKPVGTHKSLPKDVFRAGAHMVDVSPTKFPVIVNAMFTERSATEVVDRLHARALVLDDGATAIAICVVDTCMMPRDLIDRAKEIASQHTGIPTTRMLVSATHTHSAPAAMGCLGSRVDAEYAAFLPGRIAESIAGAYKNLEPARAGWAVVDDWQHTFNRRWIRRPDRILNDPFGNPTVRANMHPGHQSPDAIGPSGPVDPGLSMLSVQSRSGRPLALLANYSQHYYGSPLLSSDYFGRFAQHLSTLMSVTESTPAFVGMMSQGTSGDLMWMDYSAPSRDIGYDAYAREVAQNVVNACRGIQYRNHVQLKMAERTLALNYRTPDDARLAWARKVADGLDGRLPKLLPEIYALEAIYLHERPRTELKLQALRIGDMGITAIPNEVYAITGLKLKAQSPLQPTFNIELANGGEGYIPPPEQHELGGYTTWPARTAGLEVQAEPRIVDTLLSLLEEVSGRKRREIGESRGPYAEAVRKSSPIAYWRLNEIVPPTARDASGKGNHARYEDGVALYLPGAGTVEGPNPQPEASPFSLLQINRAPHFAGGRMKAKLKRLGNRYTVSLWFWNGLPVDARPVTGFLFSGPNGDQLLINGAIGPSGRLVFLNSFSAAAAIGSSQIPVKTWTHVALVRDGRNVTVYLNGRDPAEIRAEWQPAVSSDSGELFIGGAADNIANFEGKIDEVAVFDSALKASEIAAHVLAAGPRLVAWDGIDRSRREGE